MLFLIIFAIAHVELSAQSYAESAMQFSQRTIFGTARYQALGGANVALGGDIASTIVNPAGLGLYTKSEISITPGINIVDNNSTYFLRENQETNNNNKVAPNLNGFGFVIMLPKLETKSKWRGAAIAISVSRYNHFPSNMSYQGTNNLTSKTDWYVDQANRADNGLGVRTGDLENLDVGPVKYPVLTPAYYAYIINPLNVLPNGDTDPNNRTYFSYVRDANENLLGDIQQQETIRTTGGQSKWNFSYGANYNDVLFVGFGLGVNSLNYKREKEYKEKIISQSSFLDNFTEKDNLTTTGSGFDANLGIMYRPVSFLRLGASITSPTFYNLYESFSFNFNTTYYNSQNELRIAYEEALPGNYNYSLTTPFRFNAGGTIFFGKFGFLTLEAEHVGYNSMRLRGKNSQDLASDSQFLNRFVRSVWNYKGGIEFRYDIFRLRGGYNYQENPYRNLDKIDRSIQAFTAGFGVRLEKWFIEMALSRQSTNTVYQPYVFNPQSVYAGLEPIIQNKQVWWSSVITTGFYF